MAMAYAESLRSSCSKRKVGAVIVKNGRVISTGYNEVPPRSKPCSKAHGGCYRDGRKDSVVASLGGIVTDMSKVAEASDLVFREFRALDYCKALHAEENAILHAALSGNSSELNRATIYTTTYP